MMEKHKQEMAAKEEELTQLNDQLASAQGEAE